MGRYIYVACLFSGIEYGMKKINTFFVGLFIYIVLMLFCCLVSLRFLMFSVTLYGSIFGSFVAALISLLILGKLKFFRIFSSFEKYLIISIFLLVGYSYSITIPTIIDRSLTIYMLGELKNSPSGIEKAKLEQDLTDSYIRDYQLIPTRILEQIVSGTITVENNCIKLTRTGMYIAEISQFYKNLFLPTRVVYPEGQIGLLHNDAHKPILDNACK
jgi:hypothetical protein